VPPACGMTRPCACVPLSSVYPPGSFLIRVCACREFVCPPNDACTVSAFRTPLCCGVCSTFWTSAMTAVWTSASTMMASHTYKHVHTRTRTHTHIHTRTHTRTRAHTHTYALTHTQSHLPNLSSWLFKRLPLASTSGDVRPPLWPPPFPRQMRSRCGSA